MIKNNDFEKLLLRSAETQRAVLFTLQSGKVYAGWVVRAPNPVEQRRAIRILPVSSGYREEQTHRLAFTTSYADVLSSLAEDGDLEHLSLEDFEVIIPADQVAYAHLFDTLAYRRFSGVRGFTGGAGAGFCNGFFGD